MHYTRRELLDLLLDFVGENEDDNARNTAEKLVNIAVLNIWMKMSWRQFDMPDPYTFSTVSGTPGYALPAYFGRVKNGIIRNTTTGARIFPISLDELQERIPESGTSLDTSGPPQVYAIGGVMGVETQVLAAGEAITVVSDDAADVNVRVQIAGLDTNGRYRRTQVTLNGTVAVALGTWKKVMEASKAIPAGTTPTTEYTSSRGNVTFTAATTGAILVLAPYESAIERIQLTFWPTPNIVNTMSIPILRAPMKLLYDSDLTPLFWGPALLEELNILWQINSGDRADHPTFPGPALQDLIALENSNRFGVPSRTRPYLG